MAFDLPPPKPGIELVVATHGMSKGMSQTDGPQAFAKGFFRIGALRIGAQWKNVDLPSANGEGAIFASAGRKVGTVQLNGGVAWKFHTRVRNEPDSTALELTASASRTFGPVTARVNAIYSPDDLGATGRSLYLEAGPSLALLKGWTLSAAAGRRQRTGGPDYTTFNAGIGKSLAGLLFDLRYYDTAQSELGSPYRARIVGSAKLSF